MLQHVDLMLGLLAALFKDPNSVLEVTTLFRPPRELMKGRTAAQQPPISVNIPFAFGKRFERVGDVVGWLFEEGLDLSGLQKFLD